MTGITATAEDAEKTLVRLAICVERAGKLESLKLLLQLATLIEAPCTVGESRNATGESHDGKSSR